MKKETTEPVVEEAMPKAPDGFKLLKEGQAHILYIEEKL
jgi:hypothetical protein